MKIKYQIRKVNIKPGITVLIETEEERVEFYKAAKAAGFDKNDRIEITKLDQNYFLESWMGITHAEKDWKPPGETWRYMTYKQFMKNIED